MNKVPVQFPGIGLDFNDSKNIIKNYSKGFIKKILICNGDQNNSRVIPVEMVSNIICLKTLHCSINENVIDNSLKMLLFLTFSEKYLNFKTSYHNILSFNNYNIDSSLVDTFVFNKPQNIKTDIEYKFYDFKNEYDENIVINKIIFEVIVLNELMYYDNKLSSII